jgi:hypothetical protein
MPKIKKSEKKKSRSQNYSVIPSQNQQILSRQKLQIFYAKEKNDISCFFICAYSILLKNKELKYDGNNGYGIC